jgi:hypothetical protein
MGATLQSSKLRYINCNAVMANRIDIYSRKPQKHQETREGIGGKVSDRCQGRHQGKYTLSLQNFRCLNFSPFQTSNRSTENRQEKKTKGITKEGG